MKRIIALAAALMLLLTMPMAAAAEEFVPSISHESYPGLVIIDREGDRNIVGYVGDDAEQTKVYDTDLLITPVSDAEESQLISEKGRQELMDSYAQITAEGASLSEIMPALNAIAKELLGNYATADDFVPADMFYISVLNEELASLLDLDEEILRLTFALDVQEEEILVAMVRSNDVWQEVEEVVNNGDGTVSIAYNELGTVLFLRAAERDTSFSWTWIIIAGSVLVIGGGFWWFFLLFKKKKKDEEEEEEEQEQA